MTKIKKILSSKYRLAIIPTAIAAVIAVALFVFTHPEPDQAQAFILGNCELPVTVANPMITGETYEVRVSCVNQFGTWSQAGGVKIVSVNAAGNPTGNIWGLTQVTMTGAENLDKANNVPVGSTKLFRFNVTAPSSAGSYYFRWKLYEGSTPTLAGNGETIGLNVTVNAPSGSLSITTNPCVIASGDTTCTSPMSWTPANFPSGNYSMIRRSRNGGSQTLHSCGAASGTPTSTTAAIPASTTDTYRLYRATSWANCLANTPTGPVLATRTFTAVLAPTCDAPSPANNGWTTATSGNRAVTIPGVSGATSAKIAAWTSAGGQDDIVWYDASNLGGGNWRANINLASHPGLGSIQVRSYAVSSAGTTSCGNSNFTRLSTGTVTVTSNIPTTYTLTCNLSNPSCPSVTQGTPSTTGTHTGQPFATWTFTPAVISGYTYNITPCNSSTPCSQVLD